MNMEQKQFVASRNWRRGTEKPSAARDSHPELGAAGRGGDERTVLGSDDVTHDVFEVVPREGGRGKWNLVGEVTKDELGRQLVTVQHGAKRREVELVLIDRSERPIPAGKDAKRYPTHELLADGGFSDDVAGVAFLNRDGSHTLVIDEGQRDGPKVRLQMRRARLGGGR